MISRTPFLPDRRRKVSRRIKETMARQEHALFNVWHTSKIAERTQPIFEGGVRTIIGYV